MKLENELRIGNWVYPFDDINLVDDKVILKNCVKVSIKDFENTYSLHPIPLTEEVLLKCGFEKHKILGSYISSHYLATTLT